MQRASCGSAKPRAVYSYRNAVGKVRSQRQGLVILCRSNVRVVSVGEGLFDLIADQKGLPRDKVQSWTPYPGGAPANVATCLGKFGVPVAIISALGKDERGDQLVSLLQACNVDIAGVQRRTEPTRDIYATRDLKGDREFCGFGLATEKYSDCFLDGDHLPVDLIKSADVLVTGTLGLAYPESRKAMTKAVNTAKEAGCKVMVDINWRPVFWGDVNEARKVVSAYLDRADLIKISDADLIWLLGMEPHTALTMPCTVAGSFPRAEGVLVTAGEQGAAYCFKSLKAEHSGFVPIFKTQVADTTGAGDAFTAAFIYFMLQEGGLAQLAASPQLLKSAVVFASAAGALTCTRPGAIEGQPSLGEVEALYNSSKALYDIK